MKRLCVFAVLMMCASSAHAGGSYSFKLGSHRVTIEKSRQCRLHTCISVFKGARSLDWGRKRIDGGRDAAPAPKPVPAAPQVVSPPPPPPPAPPVSTSPAKIIVLAAPPAVQTAAVTRSIAEPPPPPVETPPAQQAAIPTPPSTETVGSVRSTPKTELVSSQSAEESPMSPIGDWQTEARGTVRIARCGDALCGHALGSSNEKGEAILINMKAKGGRQWSGNVYSQGSGDTYYGTMAMKGTDTLRVEACALYHFYCSGNNWSRISRRADSPATAEPRS